MESGNPEFKFGEEKVRYILLTVPIVVGNIEPLFILKFEPTQRAGNACFVNVKMKLFQEADRCKY